MHESIVSKAAKKMIQNEQVITSWAPALLQMFLDELLWKDSNDIQIKKLWEYLSTYCYLPRLASYAVLEDAILLRYYHKWLIKFTSQVNYRLDEMGYLCYH